MMKSCLFAALVALVPAIPASATGTAAETIAYRAYIGGMPLGTLQMAIAREGERYATKAKFEMTSFLRAFLDTDAKASSSGLMANGDAKPESFDYWVRDGKKTRATEMRFDAEGNPVEVIAKPEFRKKSYDMDISAARGAVDPATAIALLSSERAQPCAVDVTVYDGRKLHRVTLGPAERGAGGSDLTACSGTYERLGGFKAKYMTPDRRSYDFEVDLMQVAPNRWRPQRVWTDTKFGAAVAVLQ